MTVPPLLDPAALERLRQIGGPDLVRQMLALFRDGTAQRLAETRAASDAGRADGVARAAHALVSSAGNVGATELMDRARALEAAARSGAAEVPALVAQLEEAHARLAAPLAALEREVGG
jgi:HPt (histidine-containing phosphotransfer) domain-containing protein